MARLSLVLLLALSALVAAVSAGGAPPAHGHGVRQWAHQKGAQLKQWGHNEKVKLEGAWKAKIVPQIQAAARKFGAKWQEKAPKVAAAIKRQAGIYFDKAVAYAGQKLKG